LIYNILKDLAAMFVHGTSSFELL